MDKLHEYMGEGFTFAPHSADMGRSTTGHPKSSGDVLDSPYESRKGCSCERRACHSDSKAHLTTKRNVEIPIFQELEKPVQLQTHEALLLCLWLEAA